MTCKLIRNIKHSCEYSPGGIRDIYLLDIGDFIGYQFRDDMLYDTCFVEKIKVASPEYLELSSVGESNFVETQESGTYKQTLTTFVRVLEADKTANLALTASNKYLIIFRTSGGKTFCFGSDNGAAVSFTQQTGQSGETDGYSITITKNSIYPLFEIDLENSQYITGIFNYTYNDTYL
jgi:hypothetical protein